jgi:hypothetical protein
MIEIAIHAGATFTCTASGNSLPYESGLAAALAKQMKAGITSRGPGEVVVCYPCEVYAARDPERDTLEGGR